MKEIVKEKKDVYTVYQAVDGTEFNSKEECTKYEVSVEGVLRARYKPLVVTETTEQDLFSCGSDDAAVDIVKLSKPEDADTIIQMVCIYQAHLLRDEYKKYFDAMVKKVHNALQTDGFLCIGRGSCEDNFWVMESMTNVLANIKAACNPKVEEEKKDDTEGQNNKA